MPAVIVTLYTVILGLSVTISGYLSYEGLKATAGEVTLMLVIFLMSIIVASDAAISYFRTAGKSYVLPVFIFAIAAFFSIASNFNHLYSNFMRADAERLTIIRQLDAFRDDLVATRAAMEQLEVVQSAQRIRRDLTVELGSLEQQVSDPLRPGCGQECRGHLAEVERILGRQITNLAIPSIGSDARVVGDWYTRYRAAAEEIFNRTLDASSYKTAASLINRIDRVLLEFNTPDRIIHSGGGLEALAEMSAISQDIEREANTLLPPDGGVSHAYIDPTLGRLGEIVYAFQNGFGEMPNGVATFGALVLGSIIDLIPFLLSFALFGRGRLERPADAGDRDRPRIIE